MQTSTVRRLEVILEDVQKMQISIAEIITLVSSVIEENNNLAEEVSDHENKDGDTDLIIHEAIDKLKEAIT